MLLDQIISSLIYLIAVFFIIFLGKWVYDKLNPKFLLKEEIVKHDNLALALAVVGYFFGLVLAIGGILDGPSAGWVDDVTDIIFYGIVSIILLNLSAIINDKIILYKFDNIKEIIQDRNAGTGIAEAANHIAMGLIIFGAVSGEGGDLVTFAIFWILGQIVLILAGLIYNWITPFDLHEQIEKDNLDFLSLASWHGIHRPVVSERTATSGLKRLLRGTATVNPHATNGHLTGQFHATTNRRDHLGNELVALLFQRLLDELTQ